VDGRPDVLTYTSDVLHDSIGIQGHPKVHLFAATTGSDADWIVKLIDVAPLGRPESMLEGYELMIAADIMRGRYRKSVSEPAPIVANEVEEYAIELPYAAHTFLAGHRIMIQIQSSWFPLYDRNPQTFVPSIMDAPAAAYRAAVHTVNWGPRFPSRIDIPLS
jgi:putative CocE/NonD family hydrolase